MHHSTGIAALGCLTILLLGACETTTVAATCTTMTVVTHNVGDSTGRAVPIHDIAAAFDQHNDPDIVLLQEVRSQGHLLSLKAAIEDRTGRTYRFRYSYNTGIGVLADGDIVRVREFIAPASRVGYGAFAATITGAAGTVDAVGVHLDPVLKTRDRNGFSVAWGLVVQTIGEVVIPTVRARMVREIDQWLDSWSTNPRIIAGDFNTIPQSTAIRYMRRHYDDALRTSADYRTGTYWKIRGPQPRVDFVFLSDELAGIEGLVIPNRAGDHYPVLARICVSPPLPPDRHSP